MVSFSISFFAQEMRLMGNPDALMNLLKIFNMIDISGDDYIDDSEVVEIATQFLSYR